MTESSEDSGCYLLVIRLDKSCSIKVGALGLLNFEEGYYIYVGRAKRHLFARISRHFSKKKRIFWHIDYLISHPCAKPCLLLPFFGAGQSECALSHRVLRMQNAVPIKGFGSSDCQHACKSHLYRVEDHSTLHDA